MNANQNSKALMYEKVGLCFTKHYNAFKIIQPLQDVMDSFVDENNKIQPLIQQQQQGSGGTTQTKAALKNAATKQILTLVKKARPWAKKIGNNALIELWDINEADFRTEELAVAALLATLIQSIGNNETELKPYNVLSTEIVAAQAAISAFTNAIATPQQQRAVVKIATGKIPQLIKIIDNILDDADDMVEGNFATSSPDAVKEYHEARHIGSSVGQHTAIIAHIYADAEHTHPIVGAMVSIDSLKRNDDTDATGLAEIIKFKAGTYILSVAATGYTTKQVSFTVKSGKRVEVEVVMG